MYRTLGVLSIQVHMEYSDVWKIIQVYRTFRCIEYSGAYMEHSGVWNIRVCGTFRCIEHSGV